MLLYCWLWFLLMRAFFFLMVWITEAMAPLSTAVKCLLERSRCPVMGKSVQCFILESLVTVSLPVGRLRKEFGDWHASLTLLKFWLKKRPNILELVQRSCHNGYALIAVGRHSRLANVRLDGDSHPWLLRTGCSAVWPQGKHAGLSMICAEHYLAVSPVRFFLLGVICFCPLSFLFLNGVKILSNTWPSFPQWASSWLMSTWLALGLVRSLPWQPGENAEKRSHFFWGHRR